MPKTAPENGKPPRHGLGRAHEGARERESEGEGEDGREGIRQRGGQGEGRRPLQEESLSFLRDF